MRRIVTGALLLGVMAAGLGGCAPHWLRQYTTDEVKVAGWWVSVSWIRIDDWTYDVHVSRARMPAATDEAPALPPAVARTAAQEVMETVCRDVTLVGDAHMPVPRYTFHARCPR